MDAEPKKKKKIKPGSFQGLGLSPQTYKAIMSNLGPVLLKIFFLWHFGELDCGTEKKHVALS